MKNNRIKLIISASLVTFCFNSQAKENVGSTLIKPTTTVDNRSMMSNCAPAKAQTDLDINNVRARIFTGGDMWWDLINNPRYFIPKPEKPEDPGPSSLFAGSLWIGGYDAGGILKVAAQTYRQGGNDYWPGPLTLSATTDAGTCSDWDKFWKINSKDVEMYADWYEGGQEGVNPVSPTAMEVINTWPTLSSDGQPLAPYHDADGNGFYDPSQGDYPDFDIRKTKGCAAQLYGDQSIFWVFNDKGNVHTETEGQSIGLEIQAQAFAFQTSDEINNMTFYKYKIINKSSFRLDSTYFGVWDDPDLGFYLDDYVGCDVGLGLGIVYNANDVDGSGQVTAYGANPPAVGVDFFEGPYADSNAVDDNPDLVPASFTNYGDGKVDNERLGIGKFIYYDNDFSVMGNPSLAVHYYQYLTGIWKDGTPFTYGGNAHLTGAPCDYVFPGTSDPYGFGLGGDKTNPQGGANWTAAGTVSGDKRFLESAGPFTLQPGAVNTITIGVPWARATQGGALASVALLKGADDKAQQLFNNCFATLDGPDAPNLAIQELDRELILTWSNPKGSNNFNEKYTEDYDKSSSADSLYRFQGYQIYQLKDGTVAQTDLYNVDRARLVFQCDIQDNVSQIVNYVNNPLLSALVPEEKVNGLNKGIVHSLKLTTDKFAQGDNRFVNHKTYYYAIVAYGYSSTQIPVNLNLLNNYSPYIAGRNRSDAEFFHAAIPHVPSPEASGTHVHSAYGSGPEIGRLEGTGNGGLVLDLTAASEAEIVYSSTSRSNHPVYQSGRGPINVKVIDPLNVPADNFKFSMYNTHNVGMMNDSVSGGISDTAKWKLENLTTGEIVWSNTTIKQPNEQIINDQITGSGDPNDDIPKWGLSVSVSAVSDPGTNVGNNGFLEATMTFSDDSKQWLTAVTDQDGESLNNWIRSGTTTNNPNPQYSDYYAGFDDPQIYEKVLDGTWAPYRLAAYTITGTGFPYTGGPAFYHTATISGNKMQNLASVDVVITSDKSKWTRCPVIEMQEETALAIGGAPKLQMRRSPSVDKNGNPAPVGSSVSYNPNDPNYIGGMGMGWFPGYAINIETGERLNMAFGEDSWLASENGADMKWNPTSVMYSVGGPRPTFGGKHYIYVFGHNGDQRYLATQSQGMGGELRDVPRYDAGYTIYKLFTAASITSGVISDLYKSEVFRDAMWVNIPILASGHSLFETDVKVRLRVTKPYQKYSTGDKVNVGDFLVPGETYLLQSGSIMYNSKSYFTNYGIGCYTTIPQGFTVPVSFVADTALPYTVITTGNCASNPNPPIVVKTINGGNPVYDFNTVGLATHKNDEASAKEALDLINIVPNPYYAYSGYEQEAIDQVVKITNLPGKCVVSIYTLNGTLIRKITKDDSDAKASLDWDLKNQAKIPVASGLYIIHVDVPQVGEKILKWFGVMRPQDLEAY
ncbi:MAG: T9SS type A sorting domain-containing protein [Bacteroidota bacterium]